MRAWAVSGVKKYRRRRMLPGRRLRWPGATAAFSVAALVVIAAAGWLLSRKGAAGDVAALADYARKSRIRPVDLLVDGARTHRIVVLGDVPGSGSAKKVAADAIQAMALGPGLDDIVLDVPASLQPYVDAYLQSRPEDASILLAHAGLVPGPRADDYLDIYRRVWELNAKLGADRSIEIVAAGLPDWPPARAINPRAAAELWAKRPGFAAKVVASQVFARDPKARVLVFASGYDALEHAYVAISAGGGKPVEVYGLAAQLERAHPGEVFTVVQDGPPTAGGGTLAAQYTGTRAYGALRDAAADLAPPYALRVDEHFDFLDQPIRDEAAPGTQLSIHPRDYRLRDVADGYVFLGPH